MIRFEKTKPIYEKTNRRNALFERRLWKYGGIWAAKNKPKQTQCTLGAESV